MTRKVFTTPLLNLNHTLINLNHTLLHLYHTVLHSYHTLLSLYHTLLNSTTHPYIPPHSFTDHTQSYISTIHFYTSPHTHHHHHHTPPHTPTLYHTLLRFYQTLQHSIIHSHTPPHTSTHRQTLPYPALHFHPTTLSYTHPSSRHRHPSPHYPSLNTSKTDQTTVKYISLQRLVGWE